MSRLITAVAASAALLVGSSGSACADDLGTVGAVYPIAEQSMLEYITQRFQALQRSGELDKLQRAMATRTAASIAQPAPVAGLTTGESGRTRYLDPSFTLENDVIDQQGRVLYRAGTRHNPLSFMRMTRRLVFFDGRDPRQVLRARSLIKTYGDGAKAVLVGGSWTDLRRQWQMPVYYDQQGLLTQRFGITQVPAVVSQDGLAIRIDELETR